jgi:hypothetical protein
MELGLPSKDLVHSAEFLIASVLSSQPVDDPIKSVILGKAQGWWSGSQPESIFRAGENQAGWLRQFDPAFSADVPGSDSVRYLAVSRAGGMKVLLWERRK